MKFCDDCYEETEEVFIDQSFDYAGTHCTGGLAGTHHAGYMGSQCCEAETSDGIWIVCQCGEQREVHPEASLEILRCTACKRVGKWEKEY